MIAQSPRRWFRFSLRTMFVAVTLLCIWLGWQFSVVRERQAALNELKGNPAFQITTAATWKPLYPPGTPGVPDPQPARIPVWRKWLGDEAVQEIWCHPYMQGYSDSKRSELAKVFPEAEFREVHPEPCHPGCFPRGTPVDTPSGPQPVDSLKPGDFVTTVGTSGEILIGTVQSVFVTDNRLWEVETEEGVLLTTQTQPLCLTEGRIRPAGELQAGDPVLHRRDGDIHSVKVLAVSPTSRKEKVFNVVLGDCKIFVAGGFLVRSKPPPEIAARSLSN